jgi:hypothetical protein
MRKVQYSRPREQTVQYILSYGCAQPIRNLMQISINITLRTAKAATYLQCIEDHVEFDCILATNGMVDTTSVGERSENYC